MPVYNCEAFVGRALESLLSQTYGDFELVISDNASTDGTEDVCRGFAERDGRVRYVRRPDNIGGPGNFRYVFSLCSGEYHKWATADDYWDSRFLETCIAKLNADPDVVLCYSKTRLIDAAGEPISYYEDNLDLGQSSPRDRFRELFSRIGLCHAHLGVIRREAMKHTSLISPERGSDVHFLAELALYGKFAVVPEYLFHRRFHQGSSSWNRSSLDHQRQYYEPTRQIGSGMHTWRKYRHLVGGVWRSPIEVRSKVALTADLVRRSMWEREALRAEIISLVASRH
jgi:glycosyltransferase involved in cell wall biosynthesis